MAQPPEQSLGRVTKVVVATSVMLTFISFWRAAAIVLCDLGSSAFYVGGIAEQAVGKGAPWFILGSDVLLLRRPRAVRRIVRDVHPGRRLSRCQGSNGRHTRQALRFSLNVRLHSDRADLGCIGGTIYRRSPCPDSYLLRPPLAAVEGNHQLLGRGDCRFHHPLFLVAQHKGPA